jgi:hypothetical protein
MKKLIILKVEYGAGPKERAVAFKQFRDVLKKFPAVKIVKEMEPLPEVVIEIPDADYQTVYEAFCKADIVETVDNILPKEFQ